MDSVRQTQKKYGSRAMTIAIVAALVFIMIGHKPVAKGLVLGTLFSVINFVLMGQTLSLRLSQSKSKSSLLSLISIGVRYALMAVPLIMAVKMEQLNIAAVIGGLFMIQLVILSDQLIKPKTSI
jgi:hypothetical protein